MNDERKSYGFLITGLVLGLILGLLYAWVWSPVEHIDTHPVTLREDFKDSYRNLIAVAFVSNADLGRAEARLALLGDSDPARTLAIQAQQTLAENGSPQKARALDYLAVAVKNGFVGTPVADNAGGTVTGDTDDADAATSAPGTPIATLEPGVTPTITLIPTETRTPAPTTTPFPTRTPTATQGAAFKLADYKLICEIDQTTPLIMVYVYNAAARPVSGVQVIVTWDGGQDSFVTGLKPEIGPEYGDFEMTPDVSYTVRLADGGEPVTSLIAPECIDDADEPYLGSWRLNYIQP